MTKAAGPSDRYRPDPRRSNSPPPKRERHSTAPRSSPRRSQPNRSQASPPPKAPASYRPPHLRPDLTLQDGHAPPTKSAAFGREFDQRLAFYERDRATRQRAGTAGGNQKNNFNRSTWPRDGGRDRYATRSRSRSPGWDRTDENGRSGWRSMMDERERSGRLGIERERDQRDRYGDERREATQKRAVEEEDEARTTRDRERAKRGRMDEPTSAMGKAREINKHIQRTQAAEKEREKIVGPVQKKPAGKPNPVQVSGTNTPFPAPSVGSGASRNRAPGAAYPSSHHPLFQYEHYDYEAESEKPPETEKARPPTPTGPRKPAPKTAPSTAADDNNVELPVPSMPEIFSTYLNNASTTFRSVYDDFTTQIERERETNKNLSARVEQQDATLLELRVQIERMQHDWQRERMEWNALQAGWWRGLGEMGTGGMHMRGMMGAMMGMSGMMGAAGWGNSPGASPASSNAMNAPGVGHGAQQYFGIAAPNTGRAFNGGYGQGEEQDWGGGGGGGIGGQPIYRNWQLRVNHNEDGVRGRAAEEANAGAAVERLSEARDTTVVEVETKELEMGEGRGVAGSVKQEDTNE